MRTIVALCAVLAAVVVCHAQEFYSSQYDDFDATELANNIRLLKNYGKCFLDQGPCTPEGNDFKKTIPDALRTSCAKCNPKQRHLIKIVVRAFQTKLPDIWEQLVKKDDPNGQYKDGFIAFLNSAD